MGRCLMTLPEGGARVVGRCLPAFARRRGPRKKSQALPDSVCSFLVQILERVNGLTVNSYLKVEMWSGTYTRVT